MVMISEFMKLLISLMIYFATLRNSSESNLQFFLTFVRDAKSLCFPGIVSACSNVLIFIAIDNLNIMIFQICITWKYVVLLLLSGQMLQQKQQPARQRALTMVQLLSGLLQTVAVLICQLEPLSDDYIVEDQVTGAHIRDRDPVLGLLCVGVAVFLKGAIVVYRASLTYDNGVDAHSLRQYARYQVHLSVFSVLCSAVLAALLVEDSPRWPGSLAGFGGGGAASLLVWLLALTQASRALLGGATLHRCCFQSKEMMRMAALPMCVGLYYLVCASSLHWPVLTATLLLLLAVAGYAIGYWQRDMGTVI